MNMKRITQGAVITVLVLAFSFIEAGEGRALYPSDYKPGKAQVVMQKNDVFTLYLYAEKFAQGKALYCEVIPVPDRADNFKALYITFHGRRIRLTEKSWGYRALAGFGPNLEPGKQPVLVHYTLKRKGKVARFYVDVKKTKFYRYPSPLYLGKYSNQSYLYSKKAQALIRESTKHKRKAFSTYSRDMIGANRSHPRDMHYVTSPFWATRYYVKYKVVKGKKVPLRKKRSIHKGLDLRGKTGTPIYSLLRGRVVLARMTFYEGNFLVIDHGDRVFSYFMHLHKFNVKKGDMVQAGQKVGEVGSTGVSTASHLHVSLLVRGKQIDPLSILPLPMRD